MMMGRCWTVAVTEGRRERSHYILAVTPVTDCVVNTSPFACPQVFCHPARCSVGGLTSPHWEFCPATGIDMWSVIDTLAHVDT